MSVEAPRGAKKTRIKNKTREQLMGKALEMTCEDDNDRRMDAADVGFTGSHTTGSDSHPRHSDNGGPFKMNKPKVFFPLQL